MFSRTQPSPRYTALAKLYGEMHAQGYDRQVGGEIQRVSADQAFPGDQLQNHIGAIGRLIQHTESKTLLDYGSGKGLQYNQPVRSGTEGQVVANSIKELWKLDDLACYDPGVPEFAEFPNTAFDAVVATDVLEHIPEEDVFWVTDELCATAQKFLFCAIACYPAMARLPDGSNAHITVRHPQWWAGVFRAAAARHDGRAFCIALVGHGENPLGQRSLQMAYSHNIAGFKL